MARSLQFAVFLVTAAAFAYPADLAVLRNGNSIRHEHRQVVGGVTRLYLSDTASGYIEIPTNEIERFEVDSAPPPLMPQAPPPVRVPQFQQPVTVMSPPSVRPQGFATQPVLDRASLGKLVNGAGERHQIDPDFINSVIRAESGFNSRAVSKKGAQGLMQLMPGTASQLGVTNSFDPNANVEAGTKYLRELLEKYNFDVAKALAAYAGDFRSDELGVTYQLRTRDSNLELTKLAESSGLPRTGLPAHGQYQPARADGRHHQRTKRQPAGRQAAKWLRRGSKQRQGRQRPRGQHLQN